MKFTAALLALALTGCVYVPISETPIPASDLARCQQLSTQQSFLPRTGAGAATGVVVGAVTERAIGHVSLTGTTTLLGQHAATVSKLIAPHIMLPLAIVGAAMGAMQASDRRDEIVRECLRDSGFKVY